MRSNARVERRGRLVSRVLPVVYTVAFVCPIISSREDCVLSMQSPIFEFFLVSVMWHALACICHVMSSCIVSAECRAAVLFLR